MALLQATAMPDKIRPRSTDRLLPKGSNVEYES
jgi:hypothetical protein